MLQVLPIVLMMVVAGDVKDDARTFLEKCQASRFEEASANFDAKMKEVLPPAKLSQTWEGLIKQLGPITKTGEPREDKVGKSRRAKIRCEFKSTALDALVSFNAEGKIEGFFLVPAEDSKTAEGATKRADPPYVDRSKFTEEKVTVGAEGWPLPGVLTRPKGTAKSPLVILVHGSGPQDRDETIGPNTPFRDLAHGLSSRGVAVLRYDKRTKAHVARYVADPAVVAKITIKEEVVDDVLATIAQARRMSGIDPDRVFVLGHSLGGTLAPLIAQKDGKLAGVILMAASNRPPHELIRDQLDHIKKVDPDQAVELAKDKTIDEALARMKAGKARDDEKILGASVYYWKSMAAVQSAKLAGSLAKLPVLVLQGGRDYQVTEVDFDAFRQALKGRANTAFHLYPDLNHCFQKGEGKATPAEYGKPGIVDERVIRDVSGWVRSIR
ncbi:alpha/beta fold hydrolase [Paludisphaera borealis]|uniref:Esterase EstD n=1 Tax=Paludisphaera borealis TaxID=1387353 RepID=A0A1U7CVZ5_9BACT|nr:alpha/beta fold hydrolase [Paludisphaera borealis]APW63053.1 Esterase EstD [Paludisphaera borealis]